MYKKVRQCEIGELNRVVIGHDQITLSLDEHLENMMIEMSAQLMSPTKQYETGGIGLFP